MEFTAESAKHWNKNRFWNKTRNISKEILACSTTNEDGETVIPNLVALCEVENDTVLSYLTKRSPLYNAKYEYLITKSPDARGINVALLYSPLTFRLIHSYALRIEPLKGMRQTRDILYASGEVISGDTLHIFVLHAPSRFSGKHATIPYRMQVMKRLMLSVDSIKAIHHNPKIIISGDFNDETKDESVSFLLAKGMVDVSYGAKSRNGSGGTYKYQGVWSSIDHILISESLMPMFKDCNICDFPFLLEKDEKYGGMMPLRTYQGYKYKAGFSDHLPLAAHFFFVPLEL